MAEEDEPRFGGRLEALRSSLTWCARRLRASSGSAGGAGLPGEEDLVQEAIARLLRAQRRELGIVPDGRPPLADLDDAALKRFAVRALTNIWFDACR